MTGKVTLEAVRKAQRAEGPATVLAIGTATPANCVYQADYPDYYFRVTKSEHLTDLKEKFKRICTYTTLFIHPACVAFFFVIGCASSNTFLIYILHLYSLAKHELV
jgi:hypothetical protein